MANLTQGIVQAARQVASASKHDQFKVGAVLFSGKKILCVKSNVPSHPLGKMSKDGQFRLGLHAEANVLISYGLDNSRNCSLLVVRMTKKNRMTMACPCENCQSLILKVKLKGLFYSDWDGNIMEF